MRLVCGVRWGGSPRRANWKREQRGLKGSMSLGENKVKVFARQSIFDRVVRKLEIQIALEVGLGSTLEAPGDSEHFERLVYDAIARCERMSFEEALDLANSPWRQCPSGFCCDARQLNGWQLRLESRPGGLEGVPRAFCRSGTAQQGTEKRGAVDRGSEPRIECCVERAVDELDVREAGQGKQGTSSRLRRGCAADGLFEGIVEIAVAGLSGHRQDFADGTLGSAPSRFP